eukprot:4404281-Prymnesium_polylepis.1
MPSQNIYFTERLRVKTGRDVTRATPNALNFAVEGRPGFRVQGVGMGGSSGLRWVPGVGGTCRRQTTTGLNNSFRRRCIEMGGRGVGG